MLFDLLQVGDTWTGDLGALVRFRMLKLLWKHAGAGRGPRHLRLARGVTKGYARFFGASAKEPLCEGVVLKHIRSTVIGAKDGCADNPQWLKVKHRKT